MTIRIEKIVEQLESDIIFGRLRPHQELLEDALMERFDAKRHEVRTALKLLVDRSIVIKPRSKTARVKDFTTKEVSEIYFMRALLQREAVKIMPFPVAEQEINALKEIHVRYVSAVTIGAAPLLIHQLNDEFHTKLFSLCGNGMLCHAITFYTEASNPIRSYGIIDKEWLSQAVEEHAGMIMAIKEQSRDKLADMVVDHMMPTLNRWKSNHSVLPDELAV